ncbi:MAG: YjjG family noncanonical pyrimidine nucleotidase [Salibacteraceae bacterium]
MTDIQHIYFDLDHTLWDFDANSLETLGELYALFDLYERSNGLDESFFTSRYLHHNERMWAMYRENRISKSRLRSSRFESALRDMRIEDKNLAKKLGNAYIEICPKKQKLKPGVHEILELLSERYDMSILSNGFQESQLTKLSVTKLDRFFVEVITSERASAKKPNPRIFQFANTLTKVDKAHSLMIGDNLEIDVRGAESYGWKAIHFDESADQNSAGTINNLMHLKQLLIKGG